ncbi:uncharacterized protein M421DRAFT_9692 [Didymella exigua CBS 183.55]|uniref:F-box domain-containing protein n=1 Tax=Didymella exigua CBS 183.55 TaxID=1150837 RepID=A0A6A5R762_9PLEO|nr:uncharacterized protein M421DRAFT_9692 [Didymella exigua CBS 183.55]KAF1923463.1 hypothetical protein M421DRAFT_9692 [Didymella exigua CBS 183.55]
MSSVKTATTAPVWASGTAIMDLPTEILREIFNAVDSEFSKTLCSFSLTCRHFHGIVEEYCEPEYNLLWDGAARFDKAPTNRQRALRSWSRIWKAASETPFPNLKKAMVQTYGLDGLDEDSKAI